MFTLKKPYTKADYSHHAFSFDFTFASFFARSRLLIVRPIEKQQSMIIMTSKAVIAP